MPSAFVGVLVNLTQSKELAAATCCGHEIYMARRSQVMRELALCRILCVTSVRLDQLCNQQTSGSDDSRRHKSAATRTVRT